MACFAGRFLDEYSSSGGFVDLDLLDNLGSSMLISSKLTFLGDSFVLFLS